MDKIVIKQLPSGRYIWQCYDEDCSCGIYNTAAEAEAAGKRHFSRLHTKGD